MEFDKKHIEPEWWDLVNDYPEFILELSPYVIPYVQDREGDSCNLRYGFECGIGWKQLMREYFEALRTLIKSAADNGDDIHYKTCIMKEKFGELTNQGDFYGRNHKEYWDDYVRISAEFRERSRLTCEICGNPGSINTAGWRRCLCVEHRKTRDYI